MKKLFNWMLMAALVVSFGTTITACSDDDDDEKKGGNEELKADDPYEKNGEVASALFRVVGNLCGVDSLPDNWKSATYEPTKGKVLDASQPLVRSIAVASLSEAVSVFRSLTGENLADNATSASWNRDGIGSLKFTATNSSSETAVIDVNIKQMPKLSQLRLVPASAMGENGSFTGDPYYHIGDVVKDADGRHWICVRSAYSFAGKEETHWVSMQILTADSKSTKFKTNVRTINAKANKNGLHKIQQKLGNSEDTKHLKYFAQLMYILNNPSEYSNHYAKGAVLENGLGDLSVLAHDKIYVENLAKYWKDNNIWDLVLPGTIENGKLTKGKVTKAYFNNTNDGFTMLYYGHDFSALGMGSDCTIYTCQQSGTCLSTQTLGKKTWTYNASADTKYDCTEFALNGQAGANTNAGYTDKAILVVQASGKQLNGGSDPGPTKKIAKCTDVLVGNDKNFKTQQQQPDDPQPDVSPALAKPQLGALVDKNGKFWKDLKSYENEYGSAVANEPIGIVVYMGGNKRVEKGKNYNGLIMAYRDSYHNIVNQDYYEYASDDDGRISYCSTATSKYTMLSRVLDGLANTERLVNANCKAGHQHDAAKYALNYQQARYVHWGNDFSGFFLPSAGQWILAMEGMGATWSNNNGEFTKHVSLADFFDKAGAKKYCPKGDYVTSTENSFNMIYGMSIALDGSQADMELFTKSENCKVRPFIAFKYDNGGTQDPDDVATEIMEQPSKPGYVLAANGKFYKNASDTSSANTKPVALVVYANSSGDPVETGTAYHGLAINLTELKGAWGQWQTEDAKYYSTHTKNMSEIASYKDGIAQTDAAPNNSMAYKCRNNNYGYNENFPEGFSKWFLPSAGQWILAAEGLGNKWNGSSQFDKDKSTVFQSFQDAFTNAGLSDYKLTEDLKYWTNTQNSEIYIWTFSKGNGISSINFDQDQRARAFVAFKLNY